MIQQYNRTDRYSKGFPEVKYYDKEVEAICESNRSCKCFHIKR